MKLLRVMRGDYLKRPWDAAPHLLPDLIKQDRELWADDGRFGAGNRFVECGELSGRPCVIVRLEGREHSFDVGYCRFRIGGIANAEIDPGPHRVDAGLRQRGRRVAASRDEQAE